MESKCCQISRSKEKINYSANNRIKADAGKRGGATRQGHWRRGLCGTFYMMKTIITAMVLLCLLGCSKGNPEATPKEEAETKMEIDLQ